MAALDFEAAAPALALEDAAPAVADEGREEAIVPLKRGRSIEKPMRYFLTEFWLNIEFTSLL